MALSDYIKCFVVIVSLYINRQINRVKHFLGLLSVENGTYGYYEYKGVPMSTVTQPLNRLLACETYDNFRPDDVFLCTYPKTGTHFVGHIILSIYRETGLLKGKKIGLPPFEPFELAPKALRRRYTDKPLTDLDSAKSPRIILSHLPRNLLPPKVRGGQVKVIVCIRNPKDVACSMLPFKQKVGVIAPDTTFNEFINHCVNGKAPYGDYCEHLRQWYPHRHCSQVLTLVYEDLLKNLEGNVRQIAEFLNIKLTQEQVDKVVQANLFENKKKEKHPSNLLILREGKCGGWRSEFTVEQNALCDDWVNKGTQGLSDLSFQYQ